MKHWTSWVLAGFASWGAEPLNKSTIRTVKYPNEYSDTKIPHPLAPPDLGEHNAEVLKPLGYDDAKLAEFKERGII